MDRNVWLAVVVVLLAGLGWYLYRNMAVAPAVVPSVAIRPPVQPAPTRVTPVEPGK